MQTTNHRNRPRRRRTTLRTALPTALAVLAALVVLPALATAAPRWVSARYLVVRDGPTSRSKTIATLRHGEQVELLATEGPLAKVRCSAGEGWAAMRWLVAKQPEAGGGVLARYGAASRSGGKEVGATAGARGLSPEAQSYAATKPALQAATQQLLALEAVEITDEAIDTFLREGGLGDYLEVTP